MLKTRHIGLTLIILFSLFLSANPFASQKIAAQDTSCLKGLSADDCTLLTAMEHNMGVPQTFNVNFDASFKASGVRNLGNVTLSLKGAGLVNTSSVHKLTLSALVQGVQLATSVQLATTGFPKLKVNGQIGVRLVDGTLYLQSAGLNKNDGWLTVALSTLIANYGSDNDLSAFIAQFTPTYIGSLCSCTIVDVSSGKSQAGPKIDGKASEEISDIFDFGTAYDQLKTDADRKQFLTDVVSDIINPTTPLNLDDPAQFKAAVATMRGISLQYSWFVTPDDQMYHGFAAQLAVYVDPLLADRTTLSSSQTAVKMDADVTVILSKIGRTVSIPAGTGKLVDGTTLIQAAFAGSR